MVFRVAGLIAVGWLMRFVVLQATGEKIPGSTFSCNGRNSGYYADVSTGCQVYHMCDGLGRQFSYKCPSKTLFQQRMLICDHWYMVNCSKAEQDYSANLLIGQQGKAFVEDLEYSRTPRPDLVDPNNFDFTTYRLSGEASPQPARQIIGQNEDNIRNIELPPFPIHNQVTESFTEPIQYKRQETGTGVQNLNKQVFYRTSYNSAPSNNANENGEPRGRGIAFDSSQRKANDFDSQTSSKQFSTDNAFGSNERSSASASASAGNQNQAPVVNFPSNFKATTPVYPATIDIDQSKFSDFSDPLNQPSNNEKVAVNFPSNFRATTPVYPLHVDVDPSRLSEFDISIIQDPNFASVNFPSKFKATTPVYPSYVNLDPSKFSEFDVPVQEDSGVVSVNFESKFKATTPVYPKRVDVDLTKFSEFQEQPPAQSSQGDVVVNFASNYQATTPVYPKQVDVDLSKFSEPVELPIVVDAKNESVSIQPGGGNSHVNFGSSFQATTPNYPKSVELTSPNPSEVGLLAPFEKGQPETRNEESPLTYDPEESLFYKTFNRRIDDEDPFVLGNSFNSKQLTEFMLTMKPEQLKELKEMWHIPDYDFPLESVSRPDYESHLSSFQAKSSHKR